MKSRIDSFHGTSMSMDEYQQALERARMLRSQAFRAGALALMRWVSSIPGAIAAYFYRQSTSGRKLPVPQNI